MSGKIVDSKNEALRYATVIVKYNDSIEMGDNTSWTGFYAVKRIPPGIYEVQISCCGYNPVKSKGVKIVVDSTTILNQQLTIDTINKPTEGDIFIHSMPPR